MPLVLSGTNGVTFPDSSLQAAAASPYVLKNRIINGAMMIDQRNAGASVTYPGGGSVGSELYTLDRWSGNSTGSTRFSMQRSTTAPSNFVNSFLITTTTSGTPGASDFCYFNQKIEGFNVADLGFGTATASTVTVSFWVRSSLTGSFGGALSNGAANRWYAFSFTISAANTWEYKTVTIAGDTSGTWATDNNTGLRLVFNLGSGSTNKGSAGSWGSSANVAPTGSVDLVATAGATLNITGVQLEVGTSATPFERRLYNQELANCQRYGIQLGTGEQTQQVLLPSGQGQSTTAINFAYSYAVPMRTQPTLSYSALSDLFFDDGTTGGAPSALSIVTAKSSSIIATITATVTGTAASRSVILRANSTTNARLFLSAEL
jgi:hypothetical protein